MLVAAVLFGAAAWAPSSSPALARRTGSAVVVATARPDGRRVADIAGTPPRGNAGKAPAVVPAAGRDNRGTRAPAFVAGPVPPPGAGIPAPGAGYAWPLSPAPAVLQPFGAPTNPYGPGRRGVDLGGVAGQPVLAARAGTVVFAGVVAGQGVVALDHDDGLRTTYEPLTPTVTAGQVVAAGAVLGLLGAGRRGCTRVCLHWGVRRDRLTYLDPLVLLRPWRVRLLPWTDASAV